MITIKQGEDYTKVLAFEYAQTKTPVDLTGVTAFSEMRTKPAGTLLATAVCTVDADEGTISVYFSSAQTSLIPEGKCGFDVWIVENSLKHPVYTAHVNIVKRYTQNIGGA